MIGISIDTKIELAIGADLSADPSTWTWTDITRRSTAGSRTTVYQQDFSIRRGRPDESSQPDAADSSFTVDNPDGALTPDNPSSLWYPNIKLNTPCRQSIRAGSPHLSLTGAAGSRAGTPDNAALDITGDWFITIELLPPILLPPAGGNYELIGKFSATGNQRSILFFVDTTGTLSIRWSTDGTAETDAQATEDIPLSDSGPLTLAVHLDVNNGAGGKTTTFYACPGHLADLLAAPTAFVLGDPVVSAGTTSVFASTAPLDIGDVTGSGFSPYPGQVNRAQVRSGDSTGTIVANPDFTVQTDGATGFTDSAGRVWTVSSATIDKWRIRFCGEISDLGPGWLAGNLPGWAQVDVTVSGPLRRLTQGEKPIESTLRRLITAQVNADGVVAYWPFEDGRDATTIGPGIDGVKHMSIRGTYSLAADDSLDASSPLLTIASGSNAYMSAPIPRIPQVPGVAWEVTRFFRIDDPAVSPADTQLLAVDTNGRVATWRVNINDTQIGIGGQDADGVSVVLTSFVSDARFFDTWAMIVLAVLDDGVNVDWAVSLIPIPLGVSFGTSGTFVGNTGIPTHFRNSLTGPPSGISVGHLIVTSTRSIGWLAPADTAFVREPATIRVRRLCQEQGIPLLVDGPVTNTWATAVEQGVQPMGPQRPDTLTALLTDCAEVDHGILGEQRHKLGLLYRSGVTLQNQDPRLTLDFEAAHIVGEFRPRLNDQRIRNDITVSRVDGGSHRIVDDRIAAGEIGRYDESITLNVVDDLALDNQVGWRYHEHASPGLRYPAITPEVAFHPDELADDWLDATEGDMARITNLPVEHPPGDVDLLIEGSTDTWTQYSQVPKLMCSPAGPWEVGVRNDDTRGKRDTAGSELGTGIDTDDTSLSVATTLGPVWSADNAEDGFDINIGGERMTVTDISSTTSPQTFTVTRSVNGVVKSHTTGAAVSLWRPTIRAL